MRCDYDRQSRRIQSGFPPASRLLLTALPSSEFLVGFDVSADCHAVHCLDLHEPHVRPHPRARGRGAGFNSCHSGRPLSPFSCTHPLEILPSPRCAVSDRHFIAPSRKRKSLHPPRLHSLPRRLSGASWKQGDAGNLNVVQALLSCQILKPYQGL